MSGPVSPADNDPHPGVFELAWLRRTHALTEPVVQARGLCGEIASATTADRVSFLLASDRGPVLVASSATEVLDQRCDEAARLRQIAEQVFHTAVPSVGDIQLQLSEKGGLAEPIATAYNHNVLALLRTDVH